VTWPTIETDVRDVAQPLADVVKERRGRDIPSIHQEEHLEEDVLQVVKDALANPNRFKLGANVAARLARDQQFRSRVIRDTMWLASLLWPISPFIYNNLGIENLDCMAWNHWRAQIGIDILDFGHDTPFENAEACREFFMSVLNLQGVTGETSLTTATPGAEANIGSVIRLSVVTKPILTDRTLVQASIRIPSGTRVRTLDDYVNGQVMTSGMATFLSAVVRGRGSVLFAGPIGSGKTTLLRVACGVIPETEMIVVIEDGVELNLDQDRGDGLPWHPYVRSLSTVPINRAAGENEIWTMAELVRRGLRLNASRLVLGEARGAEMGAVTEALLAGQAGGMSTIHGETSDLAFRRAVTLLRHNSEYAGDIKLAQDTVAQAFNVIVVVDRDAYDLQRRVTEIVAIESAHERITVYSLNERGDGNTFRGWKRVTEQVGDLGRLGPRVAPFLPNPREVPNT
jgi:Flp pilus assembly CpaF family ATPase